MTAVERNSRGKVVSNPIDNVVSVFLVDNATNSEVP
jgi:hypothetical protein